MSFLKKIAIQGKSMKDVKSRDKNVGQESNHLSLNLGSVLYQLCDLGQVTSSLQLSVLICKM